MKRTSFTFEDARRKIRTLGGRPIAVEIQWDGDTQGWFIMMFVVIRSGWIGFYRTEVFHLGNISKGGDFRIFTGKVPPYPEAELAMEIAQQLQEEYDLEIFFPSPMRADNDCPRWMEKDKAIACRDCGKLIMAKHRPKEFSDVCYHCQLEREQIAALVKNELKYGTLRLLLINQNGSLKLRWHHGFNGKETSAPIPFSFLQQYLHTEASEKRVFLIFMEGVKLQELHAAIEQELKQLLSAYKMPKLSKAAFRMAIIEKISYEGVEYELLDRFSDQHSKISGYFHSLDTIKEAIEEKIPYVLSVNYGLYQQEDSFLRFIHYAEENQRNLPALQKHYQRIIPLADIQATLASLQKIDCLEMDGDQIKLKQMGEMLVCYF